MKWKTARQGLSRTLVVAMTFSFGWGNARGETSSLPGDVKLPQAVLPSADREQISVSKLQGSRGTVFIFVSTECPLSNAYLPTMQRLADEFEAKGIKFALLNPNEGQSLNTIAQHRTDYKIVLPCLKDGGAELAKAFGVTHCPEACLFNGEGELVYRGRIDDRYVKRGGVPKPVQEESLRLAIASLLAGSPIAKPVTEAVGCPIFVASSRSLSTQHDPNGVTYHDQVARILQKRCQECHRPDGIGPFSLLSYDQALSWAADIEAYTADGSMPPWKPVAGHGNFQNVRTMPAEEIEQLARWVQAGCPEGDPAKSPEPMEFPTGWTMGEPDLVLTPDEEYELGADGDDVYRNFVLPTNFDRDMYVSAYEILPGNRRVVHHVLMFLDNRGISEKLDAKDPGPGYTSQLGLPGFIPSGGLGGWAPGNLPHALDDGVSRLLPKGDRVVMQVHYHKSGKVERDRTKLGLYFAKAPVKRTVGAIPVLPMDARFGGMRIPPGDPNYRVVASFHVGLDLEAITITPHMHLLGKDMKVWANLPDGTKQPLVYIKAWDFNWQETYNYAQPVQLPAGTRIDLEAHFDNSEGNPHNPNRPPQLVTWGEQTNEEMCIAFLEVLSTKEASPGEKVLPPDPVAIMKGHLAKSIPGLDRLLNTKAR